MDAKNDALKVNSVFLKKERVGQRDNEGKENTVKPQNKEILMFIRKIL